MGESTSSGFFERLKRMCTRFPVRDTSYLTSVFFLLGAAFFAANGFFYVFQTVQPDTNFSTESTIAIPVTSCLGDFFFFLGCTAAILEALNTRRGKPEGSGVMVGGTEWRHTQTSHKHGGLESELLKVPVEREKTLENVENGNATPVPNSNVVLIGNPSFTWAPSTRDLREYYIKDVAFIASVISWTGIVFFTIATIAYIPGVADLSDANVYYYLALLPTFLGGFFFLVAAVMQMALTQRKWCIPALNRLCWYVGFWNSVGSIGFALGGCLWYAGESAYWAATLASFWGAWGWFIGSAISWYIIMDNY
jgi:hypothetical protein